MRNRETVLVVDDDVDIRELMRIVLERSGYSVSVAANGADALQKLETGPEPGLILLDLMMPVMDGEQFLKQMRMTRFSNTPVVILSGHASAQSKANELNVEHCLIKPIEFSELLKTVKRFLRPPAEHDVA